MQTLGRFVCLSVLSLLLSSPVVAAPPSKLAPRGTKYEQRVAQKYNNWWERLVALLSRQGMTLFSEPVHEEITTRIFGCDGDESMCADTQLEFAGPFVLAGVRWNDDPPFRLDSTQFKKTSCKASETIRFTTQPRCWYEIFKDAKRLAVSGHMPDALSGAPLLARSHFGDLQFLHSMASRDGETAADTQRRVLMWSEFGWTVAVGKYDLDTKLSDIDIPGFDEFFGKSGWTIQDLYTNGNPALRSHIQEVAFGSVLHTVEDSFAQGHTQREETSPGRCGAYVAPPRVVEFHSYTFQDEKRHAAEDARSAFARQFAGSINVVSVGRPLFSFYQSKTSWEEVKPYFECIFAVVDSTVPASAGRDFDARLRQ